MAKIKTDPKIKVNPQQGKKIAEILIKMIENSRKHHKGVYELAERCERQYAQITLAMSQNRVRNDPWDGAADYFIAMSEWTVDALHSRVMNTLFAQRPYMSAKPTSGNSVANKENVEDFNDMTLVEVVRLKENISYFFKQVIKIPMAVCKFVWASEFESMIVKEKAHTFVNAEGEAEYILVDDPKLDVKLAEMIANGHMPTPEITEVWALQDVEVKDGTDLKYIKFNDYVWAENTIKGKKPYFEGDRIYFTINELQAKANQGKFDKDAVTKIRTNITNSSTGDAISAEVTKRGTPIECYDLFCRLPFNANNVIDLEDPDAVEQEVEVILSVKEKELLMIQHWEYERYPTDDRVYIRQSYDDTEDFTGRSLLEKLYMGQKYMNQLMNTIMNNAWLSMQKVLVKPKEVQTADWEKPEIYPGAILEETIPGSVRVLDMGDVKSIGMELEKTLLDFSERISNISGPQTGAQRKQGGQRTLGEIEATIREGNKGITKFLNNCVSTLVKVVQWNTAYYKERMPPNLERRISVDGEPIFPTEENLGTFQTQGKHPYWQPEDLYGKFAWEWENTALAASKELQIAIANDMLDNMIEKPFISGNLMATWQIMKMSLEARGIKNWQDFIPSKEAVQKEMENKQKEHGEDKLKRGMDELLSVEERVQQKVGAIQGGVNAPA